MPDALLDDVGCARVMWLSLMVWRSAPGIEKGKTYPSTWYQDYIVPGIEIMKSYFI